MPTLTNRRISMRLAEWFYEPTMTFTTSGTLAVHGWTTTANTTNTWVYHSLDPVASDTDTSFTPSAITVSNAIWRLWNEAYARGWVLRYGDGTADTGEAPARRVLTPAEIEAQRQREEERQRQAAEEAQRRLLIKARADRLLRRYLTPEQAASLDRHGSFVVIGESGSRYRVRHGY